MPAFWVVKHLDVMENILPGRLPISIGLAPDPLALEQLKEAIGYRIVVTVTAPTLILGFRLCVRRKACQPWLLNWLP